MRIRTFVLALVMAVSSVALAAPSSQALKQAKEHFKQAKAFQDGGLYDKAIAEYEQAYQLAPLPDLLFNLGQVNRLKGDKHKAVDYYRKYLDADPEGRGADDARNFIVAITHEIEVDDAAAKAKADEEARRKAAADAAKPKPQVHAVTPPPQHHVVAPAGNLSRGHGLRLAGWITGGAGVVMLAVGIGFGAQASSLNDKQHNYKPGDPFDPSIVSDGQAANRNTIIFVSLGSAAIVGGGIMWYLGHRKQSERAAVSLVPALAPGVAGLAAAGTF